MSITNMQKKVKNALLAKQKIGYHRMTSMTRGNSHYPRISHYIYFRLVNCRKGSKNKEQIGARCKYIHQPISQLLFINLISYLFAISFFTFP